MGYIFMTGRLPELPKTKEITMLNFGDKVEVINHMGTVSFIGRITGINRSNPYYYDVTEFDKPYKRINGIPETSIRSI